MILNRSHNSRLRRPFRLTAFCAERPDTASFASRLPGGGLHYLLRPGRPGRGHRGFWRFVHRCRRSLPYRPLARATVSDLSRDLESGISGIRDPAPGCEVHPIPIPREVFTITGSSRIASKTSIRIIPARAVPGRRSAAPRKRAVSEWPTMSSGPGQMLPRPRLAAGQHRWCEGLLSTGIRHLPKQRPASLPVLRNGVSQDKY